MQKSPAEPDISGPPGFKSFFLGRSITAAEKPGYRVDATRVYGIDGDICNIRWRYSTIFYKTSFQLLVDITKPILDGAGYVTCILQVGVNN
jgi:hypothetical protein